MNDDPLRVWEQATRLLRNSHVEITWGAFKRRRGRIMPFGQNSLLEALIGLDDEHGQELKRFKLAHFRVTRGPVAPPASIITQEPGKAPRISLDALFEQVGRTIGEEVHFTKITHVEIGAPGRRLR